LAVLFLGEGQNHLLAKKRVSLGIPRNPLKKMSQGKNVPKFQKIMYE